MYGLKSHSNEELIRLGGVGDCGVDFTTLKAAWGQGFGLEVPMQIKLYVPSLGFKIQTVVKTVCFNKNPKRIFLNSSKTRTAAPCLGVEDFYLTH